MNKQISQKQIVNSKFSDLINNATIEDLIGIINNFVTYKQQKEILDFNGVEY